MPDQFYIVLGMLTTLAGIVGLAVAAVVELRAWSRRRKDERGARHQDDDVIGFCPDYRHPWGCLDR